IKALAAAGYYGKVSEDGKDVKVELPGAKAEKAETVTVKNVHVCCGSCKTAINKLFPDAKIEYGKPGDNKITEVTITGKGLDKAEVLKTLRSAGFNGTIE